MQNDHTALTNGIDVGVAYRELRARVTGFARDLTAEQWETVVPHCPEWTVRQTVAHLAGIVDDGINNNMEGVTTQAWTQAQVNKRADMSGPEILDEWNTWAPFVEARATERGMAMSQLVFDAVTHEHDLRYALIVPGAKDSDAVKVGVGFFAMRFAQRDGGSPIQINVDGTNLVAVDGEVPTLVAEPFEILRALGSRRTREQVLAMQWQGDPANVVDTVVPFGFPDEARLE
jgi:uncharacterized protein (TIGR03083 family)